MTCSPARRPSPTPGPHYPLPYPGGTGLGKPLKPITHPLRADLPDHPRRRRPEEHRARRRDRRRLAADLLRAQARGACTASRWKRASPGPARDAASPDFEVLAGAPVIVTDDVEGARRSRSGPGIALYIGGMGAKDVNFHARVYERMGYEAEVAKIQDLYLVRPQGRGHRRGADQADRRDRPDRPEGEAARRPRRLAGVLRDQPADPARHQRPCASWPNCSANCSDSHVHRGGHHGNTVGRLHRQAGRHHRRLVRRRAPPSSTCSPGSAPRSRCMDRNDPPAELASSIAKFIKVDLADPASIDAAIAEAPATIDVLFNNAGVAATVAGPRRHRRELPGRPPAVRGPARPHPGRAAPSSTPRRWPARAGQNHLAEINEFIDIADWDEVAGVGRRAQRADHRPVPVLQGDRAGLGHALLARHAWRRASAPCSVCPGIIDTPLLTDFRATMSDKVVDWTVGQSTGNLSPPARWPTCSPTSAAAPRP